VCVHFRLPPSLGANKPQKVLNTSTWLLCSRSSLFALLRFRPEHW